MKKTPLKRKTKLKPIGKRGRVIQARVAETVEEIKARGIQVCQNCGKRPDWRGLHPHHLTHRSQGGAHTIDNIGQWCAPCHFGPQGHRVEGVYRTGYRDRTGDKI